MDSLSNPTQSIADDLYTLRSLLSNAPALRRLILRWARIGRRYHRQLSRIHRLERSLGLLRPSTFSPGRPRLSLRTFQHKLRSIAHRLIQLELLSRRFTSITETLHATILDAPFFYTCRFLYSCPLSNQALSDKTDPLYSLEADNDLQQ